jgi:tRNA(Ile)-lysidine synthase TilS/MesJ
MLAVTFSAGKDSSVCLRFLADVRDEYGFEVQAFLYAFPVHRYADASFKDRLTEYWSKSAVPLTYVDADADDSILEGTDNPCRPCQNLRKQALPRLFQRIGRPAADVVLVSGHSLWDIAGYALDRFVARHLAVSTDYRESYSLARFKEISQRFYPFLTMPEGYSVYRPMLYTNLEQIARACEGFSLPVLATPCRYSEMRPKKLLGRYFRRFGYEFSYDGVLEFARTHLGISSVDDVQKVDQEEYLTERF